MNRLIKNNAESYLLNCVMLGCLLLLTACGKSGENADISIYDAPQKEGSEMTDSADGFFEIPDSGEADDAEFSAYTLIVSVTEEVTTEYLQSLCDKYNLSILYDYQNFNMYALASKNPLQEEEMTQLIEQLSKEEGILSVQRDRIMHLDSGMLDIKGEF